MFETIVYKFCLLAELDFMSFRFWIGTWITVVLLIFVAIDASALVCYITRFTEENFATLIAFIFIFQVNSFISFEAKITKLNSGIRFMVQAIENVFAIGAKFPIMGPNEVYDCVCTPPIGSSDSILDWAKYSKSVCLVSDLILFA